MNAEPFSLAGKRILITGGTRGIGGAIAAHAAREGAQVIANYVRNDDAAQSLQAASSGSCGRIELCRADLTTENGQQRIREAAGASLAAFVHCAATGVHRKAEELTLRHWDFTFALNLRAFFQLATALVPRLEQGSTIVALSSLGAVQAVPDYALVGATKGGIESLCRHLAVELAPRGIRVNVLSPGNVLTDAWDAFPDRDARLEEAKRRAPRQQLTTLDEVACAAHFLCSDASSGLSGHVLVVDGGQRIRA